MVYIPNGIGLLYIPVLTPICFYSVNTNTTAKKAPQTSAKPVAVLILIDPVFIVFVMWHSN